MRTKLSVIIACLILLFYNSNAVAANQVTLIFQGLTESSITLTEYSVSLLENSDFSYPETLNYYEGYNHYMVYINGDAIGMSEFGEWIHLPTQTDFAPVMWQTGIHGFIYDFVSGYGGFFPLEDPDPAFVPGNGTFWTATIDDPDPWAIDITTFTFYDNIHDTQITDFTVTELWDGFNQTVVVTFGGNPPTADAGPNQTVNPGTMVTLNGSGSTDLDDDITSYLWVQTAGPTVTLTGANKSKATFTAPDVGSVSETLSFTLTVTDSGGRQDSDTCSVTIKSAQVPPGENPPVADAGADQTVKPGATVTLDGSDSTDADEDIVSYSWVQTAGPEVVLNGADTDKPTFTAPDSSEVLTFELTVTDSKDQQDTDTCVVTVKTTGDPGDGPGTDFPENGKYTGWWYDPIKTGGNGIAIEIQHGNPLGEVLFMAWYTFDEAGNPIWYTSGNLMDSETHYSGDLLQWKGWDLKKTAGTFSSSKVGTVEINFVSANEAEVTWTLGQGASGVKTMHKFMNDLAPGEQDPRNLTGWWMDPEKDGLGVFMECQGGVLYMAWFHYGEGGYPRWWSSGNRFKEGYPIYNGALDQWSNGECLGGPHVVPDEPTHPGGVSILFYNNGEVKLLWSGGELNLQRFLFYNLQ